MSSSESSDDHDDESHNGCSCRHHNEEESESDSEYSTDYDDEDDDDSSDDSSDEEFINDRKHCFVGVYGDPQHYDTVIVCTATEIKKYRQKYSQLTQKNPKNIDIIWGDVKIQTHTFGKVPVKIYKAIGGEKPTSKDEPRKSSCTSKKETTCKSASSSVKTSASCSTSYATKANNNSKASNNVSNNLASKVTPSAKVSLASGAGISQSKTSTSSSSIPVKETKPAVNNTEIKKVSTPNNNLTNNTSTSQNRITTPTSVPQNQTASFGVSTSQTKAVARDSTVQNKKTAEKPTVPNVLPKPESTRKGNEIKPNDDRRNAQSKTPETGSAKLATGGSNLNPSVRAAKVSVNNNSEEKTLTATVIKKPDAKVVVKSNINQTPKVAVVDELANHNGRDASKKSERSVNDVATPGEAASKKKSKKQRRRERLLEKERDSSVTSTKDKSEKKNGDQSVQSKGNKSNNDKIQKRQTKKSTTDIDDDSNSSSSDDDELLANTENVPAFVAEAVKHKRKNNANQPPPSSTTSKKIETVRNSTKNNDKKEPTLQTNERPKTTLQKVQQTNNKDDVSNLPKEVRVRLSDQCTKMAVKCILANNLTEGLFHISNAISYCDNNLRLYLNRAYCYLRMRENYLALGDAQHVLNETSNFGFRFMANLRAGQASLALQEYQDAERYFTDAIKTNPYNHHARRELIRAKITHFTSKGYKERDVLIAIRKCSNFWEAMKLDFDSKIPKSSASNRKIEDNYNPDDCNHLVYASDDDEKQSNVETINHILRYVPGKSKLIHTVARPTNIRFNANSDSVATGVKVSTHKKVEEKSVWVGNLTNTIDEIKLKSAFKKFGIVKSVYRPSNEAYAFINFESSDEVSRILNNPPPVIDGVELTVRSAHHKA